MNAESSARAWTLGVGAFTVPVGILFVYIWASRSVSLVHAVWLRVSWLMDLAALAIAILVGAVLASMAVRGWARAGLLGAYVAAVAGALYGNLFCRIATRLYGQCP